MASNETPLIRIAQESDLDLLHKNLAEELPRAQLVNRFLEQRAGLRVMLVAMNGSELVGTVSYDPSPDPGGITRRLFALDVGTRFRQRGWATRLIQEVEEISLSDGQTRVRLDVSANNIAAINLYSKLGYSQQGDTFEYRWTKWSDSDGKKHEVVTETTLRMVKDLKTDSSR